MPPSLTGNPPMGSAPLATPSGSPGASANAMSMVSQALQLLNKAVSQLQPGTDPHKVVLSSIQSLTKAIPPSNEAMGIQSSTLHGLQQDAQKNAMLQRVMSSLGAGGAQQGGAPGGAPPPMQPGA